MKYKLYAGVGIFLGLLLLLIIIELLMIKLDGKPVPVPNIPRGPETFGIGRPLTFVVLGDSTSVGQGSDYDQGIARSSARYLADGGNQITLYNFGVSGARAHDVLFKQVGQSIKLKPDIVLIAVGANDITHFTSASQVEADLSLVIRQLRASNPKSKIVLTGSPFMGSVPRFPQPIRYLAGIRTAQLNQQLQSLQTKGSVFVAPLATDTGKTFSEHPELFAQDKFHPTAEGYQSWMPTLQRAFDTVAANKKL